MFFRPRFFIIHFAVVTRCNYTILSVRTTYLRVSICVHVTIYKYMRTCYVYLFTCACHPNVYLYGPVCTSIFNRARV